MKKKTHYTSKKLSLRSSTGRRKKQVTFTTPGLVCLSARSLYSIHIYEYTYSIYIGICICARYLSDMIQPASGLRTVHRQTEFFACICTTIHRFDFGTESIRYALSQDRFQTGSGSVSFAVGACAIC